MRVIGAVCPQCGLEHSGGAYNCSSCSICNRWHDGEDCFDRSITQRCRLCGEQHLIFVPCPCPMCHHFHAGKDCLPFHSNENDGSNSEWIAARAAAAIEQVGPCRRCKSWQQWRGMLRTINATSFFHITGCICIRSGRVRLQ